MRWILLVTFAVLVVSCIGTDLVDLPLGPSASEAVIDEDAISLIAGDSYQLSFRLLANDGSELVAEWDWLSRKAEVAEVEDGQVNAIASGQAWVVGVANGTLSDSVLVTVAMDPDAIATVTIEGDRSEIAVAETLQLAAVLRNVNGDEVTGEVNWTSSNNTVLSVDQDGLVTGLAEGSGRITAKSGGVESIPFEIIVGQQDMSRSGQFSGRNGYSTSGTATLIVDQDGVRLVLESDFVTQSGPGLYVYLSPAENSVSGGLELGEIKATSGMQTYELPGSVDPGQFNFAVIYCKPFGVPFGVAPLE